MSIKQFTFDPPEGWNNKTTFPTRPASEPAVRAMHQLLFDQLRDYVNGIVAKLNSTALDENGNLAGLSGSENIASAAIDGVTGTNVYTQLSSLKALINTLSVTASGLTTAAVISDYIATGAVTNAKIADGAITEVKIGTGAVSMEKLDADIINNTHYNTVLGSHALPANTTGTSNSALGYYALSVNENGTYNSALGYYALSKNTTGSCNTALGEYALSQNIGYSDCTGLGAKSEVTGPNQVQLGDLSTTTYACGAVQNRSDARDKADIENTNLGLNFIMALTPRKFKWDYREDYYDEAKETDENGKEITKRVPKERDGSKKRSREHQGFIAQEVKAVMDAQGVDFAGYQDHSVKGGKDVLSLGYQEFIAPMVKAIQEQQATINALEARIAVLEGK